MSSAVAECSLPGIEVVDLGTIKPADLDDLWQQEVQWWRERLLWDVSNAFAALRRVLERGGLPGKAVRAGARTVGYEYYMIAGGFAVIPGLYVSPDGGGTGAGRTLLKETVDDIRRKGVRRVQSQFVSIDCPWLTPAFEREGFRTDWREFLRLELRRPRAPVRSLPMLHLEPWQGTHLREAAAIMQAAYNGEADAQINELYRTSDGCQVVLENILHQGGCGIPIGEASAIARHRGRGIGFVVVTEIAPRQGHLPQVAVLPEYQGRSIGRLLLDYSVSHLAALQFDTLSLIVSRSNHRALTLYQSMGFESVLPFPVFTWER